MGEIKKTLKRLGIMEKSQQIVIYEREVSCLYVTTTADLGGFSAASVGEKKSIDKMLSNSLNYSAGNNDKKTKDFQVAEYPR